MKLLSVGLTDTTDEVRAKLQLDCIKLTQEGFRVAIDEINKGHYTFLGCNVIEGELSFRNYERIKNLLKSYVAAILAEIIVAHEEKKIIRRIVEHNYHYFSENERSIIYHNALKLLEGSSLLEPAFNYTARRDSILGKLADYLDTHHELVVEGFINFRLKEYRDKLTDLVDKAVDDFMMEVEHQEFISVLRYFVDVQETRVEEVHVVVDKGGTYRVLDSHGKAVNSQYLENFAAQSSGQINYEDLLITALITIAPYNIILHNTGAARRSDIVETIKSVFEGRVIVCSGCELCLAGIHIDSVDR
ncbi:putative sporulation protein YtxC|uniref:Putative sporulation protein YtxC n=1 Tax=Dendrosporobacter quercicolus TaxID=146817 RepID=A0A1G9KGR2_9FIRM|nr:putative sporulation protein YtxC [Dendrosporobacter quercicolus]NSL49744.1 putative sporulation protein YtxC [Dendrosporobacter quercicolus DSM 1736]SDL48799.1 putative sporulation protein YtxC [Dendrosporobacter quercicolus]